MPEELSDSQAKKIIRQGLLDRDWTKEAVEDCLSALEQMFGPWTWATVTMIKDLNEIYKEMTEDHGEPPDEDE